MSEEEVFAAKGRMLHEFNEARDRLVALEGEAKRMSNILMSLAHFMGSGGQSPVLQVGDLKDIGSERVLSLIADLNSTRARVDELRQSLRI